jgi:hypothetical protein
VKYIGDNYKFADEISIRAQVEISLKRTLRSLDDILKSDYNVKINRKKNRNYGLLQRS